MKKSIFFLFFFAFSPLSANDLALRLHNCEIELNMLKNNLQSQEEGRDKLYKEMEDTISSMKRLLKESEANASEPKQKLQKTIQGLQADCSTLKQYTNQLSSKINELSTTVSSLKKELSAQSASLKNVEDALLLLTKSLSQPKEGATVAPSKNGKYKVQQGDTLEKIAKKTGMSMKELKELNHLSSSVVRVGQELSLH